MPSVIAKGLGRVFFPDDMGQDAIAAAMPKVTEQLSSMGGSAEPKFMDRVSNPEKYPAISNDDGSISSHRMAVEVDEHGDWYAFPTLVQMPDGRLKQFEDPFEAMRYNKSIGNVKPFGKDKETAIEWGSGGYKTESFKNYKPRPDQIQVD